MSVSFVRYIFDNIRFVYTLTRTQGLKICIGWEPVFVLRFYCCFFNFVFLTQQLRLSRLKYYNIQPGGLFCKGKNEEGIFKDVNFVSTSESNA